VVLTGVTIFFILKFHSLGFMVYYFYLSFILLTVFGLLIWMFHTKKQMLGLHNLIKFIIFCGVVSIVLIDISRISSYLA
jgi:hypothetical protein